MEKKAFTLENFIEVISQVVDDIGEIKMVVRQLNLPIPPALDQWFDVDELCQYLPDKPKRATVYAWVSDGLIPVHRSSKKLRFLKSDIDVWLKQGKKKTQTEIQTEAKNYILLQRKRAKQ